MRWIDVHYRQLVWAGAVSFCLGFWALFAVACYAVVMR